MSSPHPKLTKQKTKRALFICRLYTPHMGGVERHVNKLTQELLNQGWSIDVLTEQYDAHLELQDRIQAVDVFRVPKNALSSKVSIWRWVTHFLHSRRGSWDVIHVHDVFWWCLPFRLLYPKIPLYLTFHGYEQLPAPTSKAKLWRRLSGFLANKTLGVGAWIPKWYGTPVNAVTYGGTDFTASSGSTPNILVYVGRLEADTGITEVVLAVLQQKKWKLHIYGSGSLQEWIMHVAAQASMIVVHPPTINVKHVLASATMVVASQYLSLLEAQVVGKPVLAYIHPGLKADYLRCYPGFQWLTTYATAEDVQNRLHTFSSDVPMVDAAQAWATTQTWSRVADEYLHLWQK